MTDFLGDAVDPKPVVDSTATGVGTSMYDVATAVPLSVLGGIDTTISSLSFGYFDKNVASEAVLNNSLGRASGLYQQYQDNEEGYKMAGEIAGLFLGVGAATKALRTKEYAVKAGRSLGLLKTAEDAGEFGGYIAGATRGEAIAANVAKELGEAPTQLDLLRGMFKAADLDLGAKGGLLVENTGERAAALKNLWKVGTASSLQDLAVGEIAAYALFNQSNTFYPDGMTAKEWMLTTAAFGGLMTAGTVVRSIGVAKQSAREAGLAFSAADAASKAPVATAAVEGTINNIAAKFDRLDNMRLVREGAETEAQVRAYAGSAAAQLEETIANDLKTTAKQTSWLGGQVNLSSEMNAIIRDNADSTIMRGLREIQYSDEVIGKTDKVRKKAIEGVNAQLDELRQFDEPTILQKDRIKALENQLDDIRSASIVHVNPDGAIIPDGLMPRHLGVKGYSAPVARKEGDELIWQLAANGEAKDKTVSVRANFASTMVDTAKADLIEVNKVAGVYGMMLRSPGFDEAVKKITSINVAAMKKNDIGIEALVRHLEKLPDDAARGDFLQKLKLPDGVTNLQDLKDHSLAQRADAFVQFVMDRAKANGKAKSLNDITPYEASMRFGLNLHNADGSASPLLAALQALATTHKKSLPKAMRSEAGLKELAAHVKSMPLPTEFKTAEDYAKRIKVDFDRINYNYKEKPVALVRSGAERDEFTKQGWTNRDMMRVNQEMRDERMNRAVAAAAEHLGIQTNGESLIEKLIEATKPDLHQIREYIETSAASVMQSQAAHNPIAQGLTTRRFQIENIVGGPITRSHLDRVMRVVDQHLLTRFEGAISALQRMAKVENKHHQYSMNSYFSAMQLKFPVKPGFDDAGRVAIDTKNPLSAKIWKNLTGKVMEPGQKYYVPDPMHLVNGRVVDLKVTDEARSAIRELQTLAREDLMNKNAIRYTDTKKFIPDRPHYLPFVAENNKHMVIIMDQTGRPRAQIASHDLKTAQARANEQIEALKKIDPSSEFYPTSTKDIVKYKRAEGEFASEGVAWTENASKGDLSALLKIDDTNNYAKAMLDEIASSMRGSVVDLLRTQHKEALAALKFNQRTSNLEKPFDLINTNSVRKLDDAFTLFEEAVTGYQTAKPQAWTSRLDDMTTSALEWIGDTNAARFTQKRMEGIRDTVKGLLGKRVTGDDWIDVAKKLEAEHGIAPFNNALERVRGISTYEPPADVKRVMQQSNGMAAYLILQLAEVSQGLMNAVSPLVMGPAQMSLIRRMPGESIEAHAHRIGNLGGVRGDVVIPNEFGTLISGMKGMKDKDFAKYFKTYAGRPHEEGEILNMFNRVNDTPEQAKSWWSKIFDRQTGYATLPSRFGDEFGQKYAHSIAYDFMKRSGVDVNDSLTSAYANYLARKTIVVTGPEDKANFYHTALGMPLGLFQSFVNNYLQSLYRMVEDGNKRGMLIQYSTQAMAFGMRSVPGWEQFNDLTFRNWDGSTDIDKQIERNFGKSNYDMLMNGPLWSIPKLFGADGIGLYTRGDANVRPSLGQISSPADLPSIATLGKVYDGLANAVKMVGGKADAWEGLIRSIPNRPIKGVMEIAQGYGTDRGGQITFDRTQDWGAAFYRLMGLKTMTEIEAARASYALKDIETRQREAKARLRSEVMAAIRSGNTEDIDQWAQEYVKRGGRIEAFSRWYNDTVELATQVRADRELREAIEKSKDLRDLKRLGDAMTERQ